jgi:hypothetical protein
MNEEFRRKIAGIQEKAKHQGWFDFIDQAVVEGVAFDGLSALLEVEYSKQLKLANTTAREVLFAHEIQHTVERLEAGIKD